MKKLLALLYLLAPLVLKAQPNSGPYPSKPSSGAGGTNSTVVVGSSTIGVVTNNANSYTPSVATGSITSNQLASATVDLSNFSPGATNWIGLVASNLAYTAGLNASNNDMVISNTAWLRSQIVNSNVPANYGLFGPTSGGSALPFFRFMVPKDMATNVYVIASTGVTIVTNINGDGSISYTYSASTGGVSVAATNGIYAITNGSLVYIGLNLVNGGGLTFSTNAAGAITITATGGTGIATNSGSGFNNNLTNLTVQVSFSVTNASSILQLLPTGTNLLFVGITTNSAGAYVTNQFTLGSAPYNFWAKNTNQVYTLALAQDGTLALGTNSAFQIGPTNMTFTRFGSTNGFVTTINALDYGASPALADNTAAIQAALNAASSNSASCFLPGSTNAYTCTSTLNIPDGVTFFGETTPFGGGNGNASQIFNSSSAIIMTFGNGSQVKNLEIQGTGTSGTQIGLANRYTTTGISGYSIQGDYIKNLAIGIMLSNSWDGYCPNNEISACRSSVVFSNYANNISFIGGHYGSSAYATAIGFDVRGDDLQQKNNLSFVQCGFEVTSNAFNLRGGGGSWANINITGYGEGSTNVIYANGGRNLNIDHLAFAQSGGNTTTNIVLRGVQGVSMDHNYFFNSVAFDADSATYGLYFGQNFYESTVTWNNRATTYTVDDNTNVMLVGKAMQVAGWTNTAATVMKGVETNTTITGANGLLGIDVNGARSAVTVGTGLNLSGGNLTTTATGSATNAIATVSTNDVAVGSAGADTNIDFMTPANTAANEFVSVFGTNIGNHVDLTFSIQNPTNEVTRQVLNSTNGPAVVFEAANLLPTATLNGQSITGLVQTIVCDASCFKTNSSYNSNQLAWVTEGVTSTSLQGNSTFPWLLMPLSASGTNQVAVQMKMDPAWNSNAVMVSVGLMSATNSPLTGTNAIISVITDWNGNVTAPVTVTNNIPLTGFCATNIQLIIPTAGTIVPGERAQFIVQYWAVGNGKNTNFIWMDNVTITYTNSSVQNGLVTQR